MNATTVAVDLAKNLFELAVADAEWRVTERARLSRTQFERWFQNKAVALVVETAPAVALHLDIDDRLNVVTVRIDEKRSIVVRPIVGPQAWLPVVSAASR